MSTQTPTAANLTVGSTYWTGPNRWTVVSIIATTDKKITVDVYLSDRKGDNGYSIGANRSNGHRLTTKLTGLVV